MDLGEVVKTKSVIGNLFRDPMSDSRTLKDLNDQAEWLLSGEETEKMIHSFTYEQRCRRENMVDKMIPSIPG